MDSLDKLFRNYFPVAGSMALTIVSLLTVVVSQSARPQTYNVIHNFNGGQEGENPYAGLTMDLAGILYGTTIAGGTGSGTVFKLKRTSAGWVLTTLHNFQGGDEGAFPLAGVVFGLDGSLYGTTEQMGHSNAGTVFKLKRTSAGWVLTTLHSFQGVGDGAAPNYGDLVFDKAGNIYGVTILGGFSGQGTIFALTPSGNGWTERVLYAFAVLSARRMS